MKYKLRHAIRKARQSPPSWGRGLKFEIIKQNREARGRPPRGGRGLKSEGPSQSAPRGRVAPLAGGVD